MCLEKNKRINNSLYIYCVYNAYMVSFFKKFLFLIGLVCIDQLAKYLFFDMKLLDSIFVSVFNHGISFGV